MTQELYKVFRPKTFRSIVGQDAAVKLLENKLKSDGVPHALLISGPSGTGKTTIGRILKSRLDAESNFIEMDAARNNGIDTIRGIEKRCQYVTMGGGSTVYLIDESHQLTTPAQQAFLKLLEDTPQDVYFFLATTHPQKLLPTIRNRCTHIALKAVSPSALKTLIDKVCKKIQFDLDEDVKEELIKTAEGSPRRALVLLDSVREYETAEDQLEALKDSELERASIEVCRILFRSGGSRNWPEMCKVLQSIQEDPESMRRMILGYARSCLLKQGKIVGRAAMVIESFQDNYYDSGAAGLALSCYQVIHGE